MGYRTRISIRLEGESVSLVSLAKAFSAVNKAVDQAGNKAFHDVESNERKGTLVAFSLLEPHIAAYIMHGTVISSCFPATDLIFTEGSLPEGTAREFFATPKGFKMHVKHLTM